MIEVEIAPGPAGSEAEPKTSALAQAHTVFKPAKAWASIHTLQQERRRKLHRPAANVICMVFCIAVIIVARFMDERMPQ
jgi:hypothetical protein